MTITRRMWNWLDNRLDHIIDFDDTSLAFGYFSDSKVIEQFRVTDTYVPHLFERATFYYHGHYFAMELDFTSTGFFRNRATIEMIF